MNDRRKFDLALVDTESLRLARRKKLALYSLPLLVIALLVSLKLLSLGTLTSISDSNFTKKNYSMSEAWLRPLEVLNLIEPYIVQYNLANVQFSRSNYTSAVDLYRGALETVPKNRECAVRINLALSLEALADKDASQKKYDQAILLYDQAKATLFDGEDSCGVSFNGPDDKSGEPSDDKQQTPKTLMKRIKQKSEESKRARNNDKKSQGDQKDSSSDTPASQDKLDSLERKSTESQKSRVKSQNLHRDSNEANDLSDYKAKKW